MKLLLAILALSFAAAPAAAQLKSAPAGMENAKLSIDLPIMTLAENEPSRSILLKVVPHLIGHPGYDAFKAMSLKEVQPYTKGELTDEMITEVQSQLDAYYAAN